MYILIACAFLGLFALGVFPLALELTVEATFPCDQATVTCSLRHDHGEGSGGGEVALLEGAANHLEPKDYTYYLLAVTIYMMVLISIYMFFFKTELRRTNAANYSRPPGNLTFNTNQDKDVESLLPGGMTMVRAVTP